MRVLRDPIGLIRFKRPQKHHVALLNIKTGKIIKEIIPKGRGPNELLAVRFLSNDYEIGSPLKFHDPYTNKLFSYDLDSLLRYGDATNPMERMQFKSTLLSHMSKMSAEEYICYNPYYMAYGAFKNKGSVPIFKAQLPAERVSANENDSITIDYFTHNVNGAVILADSHQKNIVVADAYSDKISVYDKNTLSLKRELLGPDLTIPKYRKFAEGNNMIVFKKGSGDFSYRLFGGVRVDNFIYLTYVHHRDNTDSKKGNRVSIFKISWDGDLIACYHLDQALYDISISKDEKTLYGNTFNKDWEPTLYKYQLP